jgi:hypothetical protein
VEYSDKAFDSDRKQGRLFPLKSMSADQYTKVPCRNHDLLLAGLAPDTLYHLRVWNKAENGAETASPAVQFRTPPKPADLYRFNPEHLGLQLSEPWSDLDPQTRAKAAAAPYIRTIRVRATWGELQPEKPDRVSWKVLDEQLADLEKQSAGKDKFIKLSLAGARHVEGRNEDTWFLEGVEILQRPRKEKAETKRRENKPEEKENVVRWDPQYLCRWLSLVKAAGGRLDSASSPDPHPAIALVAISSVSNTGEMAMTPRLLDAYREDGYTDAQIAENMKWAYRAMLQVFAEAFPHKGLAMNMGNINVDDEKGGEAGEAILDAAAATYGRRLQLAVTGFGKPDKDGPHAKLLKRYGDKVVVAGQCEKPDKDSQDPAKDLKEHFDDVIWPQTRASCLGAVHLHADALGISRERWGDDAKLKEFLAGAEKRFAELRRAAEPAEKRP